MISARTKVALQVDRGLEGRLMTYSVTDCSSEQRVHLTGVAGFA